MITTDGLRMLLVVSLPIIHLFGNVGVLEIYIVMVLMSACSAVFDASYGAALPLVMGGDFFKEGNALRSMGTSTARILGPALGGALVVWLGTANTLILDAVSYALSLVSLSMIRHPFSKDINVRNESAHFLNQAREGIRYLFHRRLIRRLVVLASIINLWGESVFSVLLYHMQRDLHFDASWSGIVMTFVGIGILLGSICSLWVMNRMSTTTSITGLLVLQLVMPITLSWSSNPVLLALCVLLYASTSEIWSVLSTVIRQSVVPNELLGRVGSASRLFSWIAMPIGSASGGAIAQEFGAWTVFRSSSVIQAVLISWWIFGSNRLARNVTNKDDHVLDVGADI